MKKTINKTLTTTKYSFVDLGRVVHYVLEVAVSRG
jgi:hypothetical protein